MKSIQILLVVTLALAGVACGPPPKLLVNQTFIGGGPRNPPADKVYQERIQATGAQDPSSKRPLYDFSVNVCDLADNGATSNCKETKVLEDVLPESIF